MPSAYPNHRPPPLDIRCPPRNPWTSSKTAEVFLTEPAFSERLLLLFEELRRDPRAVLGRDFHAIPINIRVVPGVEKEASFPERRREADESSEADSEHRGDRDE